jgi:hypothetical protein
MGMLQLADIVAWPDGMNLQAKPWAIEPTQARYLQDILLDKEEIAYMRGVVKQSTSPTTLPTSSKQAIGIVATLDPADRWRVGLLTGDTTAGHAYLEATNLGFTSLTRLTFDVGGTLTFKDTLRYRYSQGSFMKGGVLIGVSPWSEKRTQTGLALWGGSSLNAYSTGTVKCTQDSTTLTGVGTSWDDGVDVEAGMYVYAVVDIATSSGKQYIGQVKSVNSATSITLVDGALFEIDNGGSGRSYTIKPIRPLDRHVSKGQITCTTSQAVVNGSGTKFKRQGLGSGGPWAIFRADDMKYVGKVTSVASDIQLTLTGNANITCNKEEFVAIDLTGDRSVNITDVKDFGWLSAQFAGRQWYANNPYSSRAKEHNESRVSFSRYFDPEAVDNTADGDHIFIPSSKAPLHSITGLFGHASCLLVFKDNETYGIFGTSEADFSQRWLHGDGALSPMVIQDWQGGCVWAGEKGIWFFDGNEVYSLIDDRIGDWYEKAVEGHKAKTYPATSMIYKGNYIVHIPYANPPIVPDLTANDDNTGTGTAQDYMTLCINLPRRAVSTLTNMAILGGVSSPLEELQGTIYAVNHCNTTAPYAFNAAYLCRAQDLFTEESGTDTLNTKHVTAGDYRGPDIFIESGRYDFGSPQVKKRIKQLMGNFWIKSTSGQYIALGNTGAGATDYDNNYLNFATLVGLNEIATTSNGKWRLTRTKNTAGNFVSGFQNRRVKFNKKSQFLGFKIWPSTTNTGFDKIVFGAMALAYKDKRPGQV